jgi:hypothetical protein
MAAPEVLVVPELPAGEMAVMVATAVTALRSE